ncbi:MAG: VOC family protein [Actinomycetota bacterium]
MPERSGGPFRIRQVVLDAREVDTVATFWSELLGWPMHRWSDEWISMTDGQATLAIQYAADHQPPSWGDPDRPQQAHLDIVVDDIARAETTVLELGGTKLGAQDGEVEGFRIYADPAGHPFCLEYSLR